MSIQDRTNKFSQTFNSIPDQAREQDGLKKAAFALGQGEYQCALKGLACLESAPARIMRAELLCDQKEYDLARTECLQVIEQEQNAYGAYNCLGHIARAEGNVDDSRQAFLASIALEANGRVAQTNLVGENRDSVTADRSDASIVTSIPPRDVERHYASTRNWVEGGFEVISLNTQAEIDQLQGLLPHVIFEKAPRTACEKFGRDYVYLDDVLDVLAACGKRIGGIVNADILLHGAADLLTQLPQATDQGLVFGSRVDVDTGLKQWRSYDVGFDYFFMSPALAAELPRQTSYCLGLPWWDYYLPMATAKKGAHIFLNHTPVAYHGVHAINWSPRLFHALGADFVQDTTGLWFEDGLSAPVVSFADMTAQEQFLVGVAKYVVRRLRLLAKPISIETDNLTRLASPLDLKRYGMANELTLLEGLEGVVEGLGLKGA